GYDVFHFSGHGSRDGICLETADYIAAELVSAKRLVSLMTLTEKTPLLVMLTCCYSKELVPTLSEAAPFVITTGNEIDDRSSLTFVESFYENFFKKRLVSVSFEHATNLLKAKNLNSAPIELSRRRLVPQD